MLRVEGTETGFPLSRGARRERKFCRSDGIMPDFLGDSASLREKILSFWRHYLVRCRYLIRCGWSASAPKRDLRSASYSE